MAKILGDIGDFNAPKGSAPWAIAIKTELQILIKDRNTTASRIKPFLEMMEEHSGYKALDFQSLDEFIEAKYPYGLGGEVKREDGEYVLGNVGRPTKEEQENKPYNYKDYGTTQSYIIARIQRDAQSDLIYPTGHTAVDILEKWNNGGFKSARQAGIAAGFVKDTKRLQVKADPERIAEKIKEILTDEEVRYLIELLTEVI